MINPNSDEGMTDRIQDSAERFARGRFVAECVSTPGAPRLIESHADMAAAGPGMIRVVRENEDESDGLVVACHFDSHLDVMKEITTKPVVGMGEASLRVAAMLGLAFSLIATDERSIPIHRDLIRKYGLQDAVASIRTPAAGLGDLPDKERYLEAAHEAVEKDGAEVIVLGCAALTGLDGFLREQIHFPVLDGVVCALGLVEGLARYGVGISKVRRYHPDASD